jgi:hypothetical protein
MYFLITAWLHKIPPASEFFGHSLGIVGFVMMLMTETLYSIRKRQRTARWGRMSTWLEFHIFTGIVGPFMVLLHSSGKFHGLAGIVTLMTLAVVISGFVGRYIYTSIPRTLDGVEMEASQMRSQIQSIEVALADRLEAPYNSSQITRPITKTNTFIPGNLFSSASDGGGIAVGRSAAEPGGQSPLWGISSQPAPVPQDEQLDQLVKRHAALNRQLTTLAAARRLMALWHAIHVPLGLALFTAAFIHIAAAIYYATLLR